MSDLNNNLGKIVDRVRRGFNNLKMLQPHPRVTQLLGYCIAGNITVMITELGTWGDLRQFLLTNTFKEFTMAQRTDIALQVKFFDSYNKFGDNFRGVAGLTAIIPGQL